MAKAYTIGRIITNAFKRANMENFTEHGISRTQLLNLLHDAITVVFSKVFREDKSYYWTTDSTAVTSDAGGIIDVTSKNIALYDDMVLNETSVVYNKQILIYQPDEFQTEKLFLSSSLKNEIIAKLETYQSTLTTKRLVLAKGSNISTAYNVLTYSLSYYRVPTKVVYLTSWVITLAQTPDILDHRGELVIEVLTQMLTDKRELKKVEAAQ